MDTGDTPRKRPRFSNEFTDLRKSNTTNVHSANVQPSFRCQFGSENAGGLVGRTRAKPPSSSTHMPISTVASGGRPLRAQHLATNIPPSVTGLHIVPRARLASACLPATTLVDATRIRPLTAPPRPQPHASTSRGNDDSEHGRQQLVSLRPPDASSILPSGYHVSEQPPMLSGITRVGRHDNHPPMFVFDLEASSRKEVTHISGTRIAIATDVRDSSGVAEIFGLSIEADPPEWRSREDHELARGLETSPRKSRIAKDSLARRAKNVLDRQRIGTALWRNTLTAQHRPPDLVLHVCTVLHPSHSAALSGPKLSIILCAHSEKEEGNVLVMLQLLTQQLMEGQVIQAWNPSYHTCRIEHPYMYKFITQAILCTHYKLI